MISRDDIKNAFLFSTLPDELVDRIIAISKPRSFEEGEVIFAEGGQSGTFYLVRSGTILIEQEMTRHMTVTVATLNAGECFGYSSLMEEMSFSTTAVSSEASEVILIDGKALVEIMEKDHSLGYLIHRQMVQMMAGRLQRRTEQFLRALSTHPEIHELEKS
ncbi:Crp/Fnr family transcriptional regulator [Desulfoluna butyratoxydans]|uniref:Cyclic nucleotide-binding-like n=1 Tax=Desulfoluna butyratoxydans TaxID=231438 RepID=A0A4U8YJ74_9BACT|nr:Crp/Fnr family transcriptional regulator [Desulfoluna butyratoxydans]VFQ43427.1 cyclic nucleotide-binding-like [Desulfoluna butyratoxydans]